MLEIERYLDRLLGSSGLSAREAARRRPELAEHLENLVQERRNDCLSEEEAVRKACEAFGNPVRVGRAIGQACGNSIGFWGRWFRPVPIALGLLVLGWSVNAFAFQVYSISGNSLGTLLPQGSRVVVEKWSETTVPGDIVVYRDGTRDFVGVVVEAPAGQSLMLRRGSEASFCIERRNLVGRVVLRIPEWKPIK